MINLLTLNETIVNISDDESMLITWNGSATFTVYDFVDGEIIPGDCFTMYGTDTVEQARVEATHYMNNLLK